MAKKYESLDIQVSTICNLKCDHCGMFYSLTGENVNFSSIEEYIKNNNPKEVYLGGGEPLLKDYDKILNLIRKFPNIEFKLVTNLCYDLNPTRISILKEVESLQTSFDIGIRFHSINNLLKWYKNVKYVINNVNSELEVIICLTKKLIKINPLKISKLMNNLGVHGYRYSVTYNFGKALNNKNLSITKQEYIDFMNKVLDINDKLDQTYKVILSGDITSCPYNSYTQAIDWNGKEVHCVCKERWDKKCHNSIDNCLICKDYTLCGGKCEMVQCLYSKELYNKALNIEIDKKGINKMFLDFDFYKFNKKLLEEYMDEVLKDFGNEELDLKTCYEISERFETMVYLNGLYIDKQNRYQCLPYMIAECKDDDYNILKEKIENFVLMKNVFNRLMNSIHLNIVYNMHILKTKKDIKEFILVRLDPIVKEKLDHMKV